MTERLKFQKLDRNKTVWQRLYDAALRVGHSDEQARIYADEMHPYVLSERRDASCLAWYQGYDTGRSPGAGHVNPFGR